MFWVWFVVSSPFSFASIRLLLENLPENEKQAFILTSIPYPHDAFHSSSCNLSKSCLNPSSVEIKRMIEVVNNHSC